MQIYKSHEIAPDDARFLREFTDIQAMADTRSWKSLLEHLDGWVAAEKTELTESATFTPDEVQVQKLRYALMKCVVENLKSEVDGMVKYRHSLLSKLSDPDAEMKEDGDNPDPQP